MEIGIADLDWWRSERTEAQRMALVRTIEAWARGMADGWELLDPQESRQMYHVLSKALDEWRQGRPGSSNLEVHEAWAQLPDRAKAAWVGSLGQGLDLSESGREAARVVSEALAPTPFRSLPAPEQVDLLRTIAGEVETYLDHDPAWYSKATPAYRGMAEAIRRVEDLTQPPDGEPCRIWWSHLSMGAREQVLGEVAQFARWAARGEEVRAPVRQALMDLARSTEQTLAPVRAVRGE